MIRLSTKADQSGYKLLHYSLQEEASILGFPM